MISTIAMKKPEGQDSNISLAMVLALACAVLFACLIVDFGLFLVAREEASSAAEAAALAAAADCLFGRDGRGSAQEAAKLHGCELTSYTVGNSIVQVSLRKEVKFTLLARFLFKSRHVNAVAAAEFDPDWLSDLLSDATTKEMTQ